MSRALRMAKSVGIGLVAFALTLILMQVALGLFFRVFDGD